jgi:glycosyltransferase involved in cell wall biosynthesis
MLRVFSACVNRHGLDIEMVLTGKDFCGQSFWDRLIRELNIEERVHITGWISDQERENYLNHATMLWQFSWYEGFGLPVLEAASRGIPVMYSNRGSLPEILNNPEQEVDPENENDAADKAAQALQSPDMLARWKRVGLQRSSGFSWDKSAQTLINHLNKLA